MIGHGLCIDLIPAINMLKEFVSASVKIRRPENHIKVRAAQYKEREMPARTEADMAGEAVRIMSSLESCTAILKTRTYKGVIKTSPLADKQTALIDNKMFAKSAAYLYCGNLRERVEKELAERRASWKPKPETDGPPAPEY